MSALRQGPSEPASQPHPWLELRGIGKTYPGVRALEGVDLALSEGEILGLVGENGAGKSTLIRVIGGVVRPDVGSIVIDGQSVDFRKPSDAAARGISVIHQELEVLSTLSVTENVLLGNLPALRPGVVNWPAAHKRAAAILGLLDLAIDPRRRLGSLRTAERQLVAIARALGSDARLVVMDEPTAALNETDIETLFGLLQSIRRRGTSIIYVSHRLPEIMQLSDRIIVMRDGRATFATKTSEASMPSLIRAMIGGEIAEVRPRRRHIEGRPVLEVRGLAAEHRFEPITFEVGRGEIVALYGLLGAGCTDVTRAIFGSLPASSGQIVINGVPVTIRNPPAARRAGIGLVPAERRQEGLVLVADVATNVVLANLPKYSRHGVVQGKQVRASATRWVKELAIRLTSITARVSTLSGGNQQKVILARWLDAASRLLILEEPSRGVDVAAKAEISRLIGDLCEKGAAILLVSSEIPEILALADRVIVMSRGSVTAEFMQSEATRELLVAHAAA